jgi:hypothetical protein
MAQLGIDNLTELRSRGASKPEKTGFWRQPDGNVITSRFICDIPQSVDAIVAQLI